MAVPCKGSSTGISAGRQPMPSADVSSEHQQHTRHNSHIRSSISNRLRRSGSSSSSWFAWRPSRKFLLAVLALLVLQAAVAVNVIYDETGWTKVDWHKYKIDFDINLGADPADEVLKSPEVKKLLTEAHINSLHGPAKRRTVNKFAELWSRDDGSLVASPSEDAVEQAAEAVMCTTCHSLVSHVWGQLVWAVNRAEPITEAYVKDLIEDSCESQVPGKVLNKYRIVQVEAPELDVSLFVVRERKGRLSSSGTGSSSSKGTKELPAAGSKDSEGSATTTTTTTSSSSSSKGSSSSSEKGDSQGPTGSLPSDVTTAEAEAVQKACTDLSMHHVSAIQKQMWPKVREYFQERLTLAQKVLTKAAWYNDDSFWEPDAYEDPDDDYVVTDRSLSMSTIKLASAQKLTPADQLCLDMDVMCVFWAQQGQCKANPAYMVGDKTHVGHCKASCKACSPKTIWKKHPLVKQELRKAAAAAGQLLRTSACSASKACMAGGSSTIAAAAAVKEGGSLLPGAVLAKTPGFVLGKPFWAVPTVSIDPTGGLKPEQRELDVTKHDPADEVLISDGLGHKFVSIPGMDNFFTYQLEYKRRVYQYAKDKNTQVIKEEHTLGTYDRAATAAAAVNDKLVATRHPEIARAWTAQWKLQQAASKHSAGAAAAAAGGGGGEKGGEEKAPPATPMLELLDYLPDTEAMLASHWPYMRQMYTKGETCIVDGKPVARQVELRAACSPDSSMHMLVREPAFCSYIMVLYHPTLCDVDRLKPVPVLGSSSSSSGNGSSGGSDDSKGKSDPSNSSGGGSSDSSSGGAKDGKGSSSGAGQQGKAAAAAAAAAKVIPPDSNNGKEAGDKAGIGSKEAVLDKDAKTAAAEGGEDSSRNKKLSTS